MGHEASNRIARRETKRTLGRHLEEFAAKHMAKLEEIEKLTKALTEDIDRTSKRLRKLEDRIYELESVRLRDRKGRLKWLVSGK